MQKSAKLKAEEQFAATQRKDEQALHDKEKAQQDVTDRVARQRGLRLAKEAVDKKIADAAIAEKEAAAAEKAAAAAAKKAAAKKK